MLCAWIGDTEIIPFDSIEYVDDASSNDSAHIEVHMQSSGKICNIVGQADVDAFTKAYGDYLRQISKALTLMGVE